MDQVLYLTEPLDELMVQSIDEFASYRLVDAAKGNLDIPEIEDDEEKTEEAKKDLAAVAMRIVRVVVRTPQARLARALALAVRIVGAVAKAKRLHLDALVVVHVLVRVVARRHLLGLGLLEQVKLGAKDHDREAVAEAHHHRVREQARAVEMITDRAKELSHERLEGPWQPAM